jgi:hypothetical protein
LAVAAHRTAPSADLLTVNKISLIAVTNDILRKLTLLGKDLSEYSLDTVKMFHRDTAESGFSL